MNPRYLAEREALASREVDAVEVTRFGGPSQFLSIGPRPQDYVALARTAYVRGDLTVEEFEAELDRLSSEAFA